MPEVNLAYAIGEIAELKRKMSQLQLHLKSTVETVINLCYELKIRMDQIETEYGGPKK